MSLFSSTSFFSNGSSSTTHRSRTSSSSSTATSRPSSQEPLGAIRNRENLVVSNREIRQLFDTMKELGNIVKRQSAQLDSMSAKLENASKEVNDMKAQIKTVIDRQSSAAEKENNHRGPVPKQLKGDVHLLHNKQEKERQFRGSEGIESPHNSAIRSFLCNELQKETDSYEKPTIMRAVTRYYETKRQQHLNSLPTRRVSAEKRQCEKRLTSRRRRLFIKRMKVATGPEREAMQQIDPAFMSDEEDGEDNLEGSWVVRSPPWRSPRLSSLLKNLQGRVDANGSSTSHPKNPRVHGEPSARDPPLSPAWALATVGREDREGSLASRPASPIQSPPSSPRHSICDNDDGDTDGSLNEDDFGVLDRSPVVERRPRRIRQIRD